MKSKKMKKLKKTRRRYRGGIVTKPGQKQTIKSAFKKPSITSRNISKHISFNPESSFRKLDINDGITDTKVSTKNMDVKPLSKNTLVFVKKPTELIEKRKIQSEQILQQDPARYWTTDDQWCKYYINLLKRKRDYGLSFSLNEKDNNIYNKISRNGSLKDTYGCAKRIHDLIEKENKKFEDLADYALEI